jgi:integrase/recombinase XerD
MTGGLYGGGMAPERAVMPLCQWPEEDRRVWETTISPTNPFVDIGGERAALRRHSNRRVETSYGRWLTFLKRSGELARSAKPEGRIRLEMVQHFIRELQALGNKPSTIALRLTDLLLMARIFDPVGDWRFIRNLAEKVRAQGTSDNGKRARLRGSDELYDLGERLMTEAEDQPNPAAAASFFRDGLMIALLALVPLRRKNFVQLRIGKELRKQDGKWQVDLPASATKTHAALSFDWPAELEQSLETYLQTHRPVLVARSYRWLTRADDHLWVALSGSALTEMAFYDIVRKRTRKAFGIAINPHAFRDAAATTLAIHDPEHIRAAAPVLGHRSLATTERFYNQARSLDAHRRYVKALSQLRHSTRRSTP